MAARLGIKKGDVVQVLAGKDKGKRGKILRVDLGKRAVTVERANFVQRHRKPTSAQRQGGILEIEAGIDVSNVGIVCKSCDRPVRARAKILENGSKVRVCHRCAEVLD
ncbi:MAG: 50S ribosomal protein L24 [Candidatus Schekmanbacteria bacterium]|nr:50S ribosomal protein L24 [Candidatus Schekmanbacteria bacterium]